MIIDFSQIEKNIARIKCGSQMGTAFLIEDDIAISAKHVICEYSEENNIILEFLNLTDEIVEVNALPLYIEKTEELEIDVVVLKLDEKFDGFEHLVFGDGINPYNAKWKTFAYPAIERNHGLILEGVIKQAKENYNPYDYDLILKYEEEIFETDGMSGAPIIIDEKVKGIITDDKRTIGLLGAFSVNKMFPLLQEINLPYLEDTENEEKDSVIENFNTEDMIKEFILEFNSGYLFVRGGPGVGKTTLASNLEFNEEKIEVIGKYFLKEIDGEYNIQYKASEEIFGKWFINTISKFLYNTLIEEKNYSYQDLIQKSQKFFTNLCKKAIEEDRKYIFIIDGIDEVYNLSAEKLERFMGILPDELKKNIFIVIFGNNESHLPFFIEEKINEDSIIDVLPLGKIEVRNFIKKNLKYDTISYKKIEKLEIKSEGNPLYLHYIINYLNNHQENEIIDEFIEEIPAINGTIMNYYKKYWNKIKSNDKLVKLVSILARLRNEISKVDFLNMFTDEEKFIFEDMISNVNHLLKGDDYLSIYHNSFSSFVKEETSFLDKEIHKIISRFCLENQKNKFSVKNILYHLINSDEEGIEKAIELCNQEWIDICAIQNINPDVIIIDSKSVLEAAIVSRNVSEIIRILLLIQRSRFRNDKMFKKYAIEMSKALYELGKEESALNYIIREGMLVIPDEEAIYLLRKYLQDNLINNAKIILSAIQDRCIEEYHKDSFSIKTLFTDIQAISLFPKYDPINRLETFDNLLSEIDFNDKKEIKQAISAKIQSYIMWEKDKYAKIKFLKEEMDTKITKDSIDLIIKVILFYKEIEEQFYKKDENKSIVEATKDLEDLLIQYNISENNMAVQALIEESENVKLLNKLISNQKTVKLNLRLENGVDFNYRNFLDYFNYYTNLGYIDLEENYPKINDAKDWEKFIISIIELTAFILGKCYRANAEGMTEIYDKVKLKLDYLVNEFNFTLKDRVSWERSYFIPEDILPYIYQYITKIYISFFNDDLDELLDFILNSYQLGIYIEGYRKILFNVSNEIIRNKNIQRKAFEIIKKLEEITENFVLNRWERTRDYLKIIELYGKINCVEIAKKVFEKMLDTSMGPSWYKEAQFTLMSTGIEKLKKLQGKEKYFRKMISYLDYSSGEMTFQRYVRDEKENFVGVITKVLGIDKGIEYFKRLTLPDNKTLINNVNMDKFDLVEEGRGYVQGTREIDPQDAISYFLKELTDVDLIIKWGLTEIFIQGDDRYFNDYVNMQLEILEKIKDICESDYKNIINRIKKQFVSELDNKRRNKYLDIIKDYKNQNISEVLLNEIIELDIPIEENIKKEYYEDISNNESSKGKDNKLILAKEEIKFENLEKAKEILINELTKINKEGMYIFNYSQHSISCLNLLKTICSAEEMVYLLKEIISNSNLTNEWVLANDLIKLVGKKVNNEKANKIIENILEHLDYLIRMPNEILEKHNWIEKEIITDSSTNDSKITDFMIWLTNFPNGMIIKKRSIEVLVWLSKMRPEIFIPNLINEALKANFKASNEISANIIHILSQTKLLEYIWYYIYHNKDIQSKILMEQHFLIKSCFFETVFEAKQKYLHGADEFYFEFEEKLFNEINSDNKKSKVKIKDNIPWLNKSLMYLIEAISEHTTIDNSFIEKLKLVIKDRIEPLDFEEYKEIEAYIERSYSINNLSNIYNFTFRYGINKLLNKYVTKDNYFNLKDIMRKYNPYFPESKLSFKRPKIFKKIKDIFIGKSNQYENCYLYKDKYILHFNEIIENKKENKGDRIEVIGFLIHKDKTLPVPGEKLYDYFTSNILPKEVVVGLKNYTKIYPLILKLEFGLSYCNMYTPSEIHPSFKRKYRIKDENIEKTTWRYGRTLDAYRFGMPQMEGCLLTANKESLDKIDNDYRLMYLVKFNDNFMFIDVT